ncbi:MAG: hypothetical protein IPK74_25010 [Deltaproteobacteria bacterium]|nr:hypothetical protein [Deltaproteobacteria bacterium]
MRLLVGNLRVLRMRQTRRNPSRALSIAQVLSNLDDEELRDLVFAYYAGRHTFDGCSGTSRLVLRTLSRSESIATLSGSIRELSRYLTAYKQKIGKLTYFEPEMACGDGDGTVLVRSPFSASYVAEFKAAVPPDARRWIAAYRAWSISEDYASIVERLLARHFPSAESPENNDDPAVD